MPSLEELESGYQASIASSPAVYGDIPSGVTPTDIIIKGANSSPIAPSDIPTTSATTPSISLADLEAGYQSSLPRTWGETGTDIGKSLVKSGSGVLGALSQIGDISSGTFVNNKLAEAFGLPTQPSLSSGAQAIDEYRKQQVGDPEYRNASTTEKILSQGIGAIPYAVMGGGVPAAIGSGIGGETAKTFGLPEWAGQIAGGGIISILDDALRGTLKTLPEGAATYRERAAGSLPGDYIRSNKKDGLDLFTYDEAGNRTVNLDPKTKIQKSLTSVIEDGVLDGSVEPKAVLQKEAQNYLNLNNDLSTVLSKAETNLGAIKVRPKFSRAQDYIDTLAPVEEKAALQKRLDNLKGLVKESNGKLSFLQKEKVALNEKTYDTGQEAAEAFDKALTADFRKTIEDVVDAASPEHSGQVKSLNQKIGSYIEALPLAKRAVLKAQGETVGDRIINFMKTTGGYGTAIAAGNTLVGGPVGFALGVGAGKGISYLRSPAGMNNTAKAMEFLGNTAAKAPGDGIKSILGATVQGIENPSNPIYPQRTQESPKTSQTKQPTQLIPSTKVDTPAVASQVKDAAKEVKKEVKLTPKLESALTRDDKPSKKTIGALVTQQPKLVQAVIKVESSNKKNPFGNPLSQSDKGPRGLMQVAQHMEKRVGISDWKDPVQSIKGGTKLLNEAFSNWKDPLVALAEYNQGNPAIRAAMRQAGITDKKQVTWERIHPYLTEEAKAYPIKVANALTQISKGEA